MAIGRVVNQNVVSPTTINTFKKLLQLQKEEDPPSHRQLVRTTSNSRDLQTARFRNNYVGRFQYLLDGGCSGFKPTLQAFCKGSISILGTSHSSIECLPLASDTAEPGYNGYECVNTCADVAACNNIYLEGSKLDDGVFGEVFFQCEGPNVEDVEGFFTWEASTGSCDGTNFLGDGRNFHVAQLGVYCEDEDVFRAGPEDFECCCSSNTATYKRFGDALAYTCLTGRNCKSDECDITFGRLVVESDLHNHDCIQSLDGSAVPEVAAPDIDPRPAGMYSTKFRANWQLELDSSWCSGQFPSITVSCTNGVVTELSTISATTNCVEVSDSRIECSETDQNVFVNADSGLEYTCTAVDAIPTTEVIYEEGNTVTCSISRDNSVNRHRLRLAPFCGSVVAGGDYRNWDDYCECGNDNTFTHSDDGYTCYAFVGVPPPQGRGGIS